MDKYWKYSDFYGLKLFIFGWVYITEIQCKLFYKKMNQNGFIGLFMILHHITHYSD